MYNFISGGLFVGLPDKIEKSWILTDDDVKYLAEMYSKTGFRYTVCSVSHKDRETSVSAGSFLQDLLGIHLTIQ